MHRGTKKGEVICIRHTCHTWPIDMRYMLSSTLHWCSLLVGLNPAGVWQYLLPFLCLDAASTNSFVSDMTTACIRFLAGQRS